MSMIVLVRGSLKGMGREAECEVVAMKRTIVNTRDSREHFEEVYTEFGIVDAPADLPDGAYTVCVGKQTFRSTLRHGLWLNNFEVQPKLTTTSGPATIPLVPIRRT